MINAADKIKNTPAAIHAYPIPASIYTPNTMLPDPDKKNKST